MSTNAEAPAAVVEHANAPTDAAHRNTNATIADANRHMQLNRPSLTEALTLRRNLLRSLWIGVRQLPRGRRIVLMVRLCISFAQIVAFIPVLALPGSHRVSPSHEDGRVCNPDSLLKYLVVHIVRLALDIPVELYLGLSPHRTRRGRRAGPEARAIAERDRPLGSEYLDIKVGKISTLLGIASLVIFFVGNAIVYSSTECSQRPAEAVPLFWAALASLIVVYIFIFEIAVLAFLIVCALPVLIVIMRALGLTHRLPQRELHPETGKIDQKEVDKRVKLVYYTPAEEDEDGREGGDAISTQPDREGDEAVKSGEDAEEAMPNRPGLGSRRATQDTVQTASQRGVLGRLSRLTRILIARRRSAPPNTTKPAASSTHPSSPTTPQPEPGTSPNTSQPTASKRGRKLKYPLHPLPAHRATCPICLCDFEEPQPHAEPEPEPLRLLACGHVLHRSCVDQWFTSVSGRCPVCQRAVIGDDGEEEPQQQVTGQGERGQQGEAMQATQAMVEARQSGNGEAGTSGTAAVEESLELQPLGPGVDAAAGRS
ncbi:conserved hypothetical protein [Sporisorium reilianum SRZ2]|uniref:RING-type domain-containing protein n=1 Tax=Sporisorium reilianum (strain SRZ2) TaxID=999809 RepID=E7A1L5_SPORE|nr:conserved hypothetical protein [Sporisorium reilianum SRZ2]